MPKKTRLIWVCPEFTPYHDVMFSLLASDPGISLRVEVMMKPTESHPFQFQSERRFEWGIARSPDTVDYDLISRVLKEEEAAVVVSSYYKPTLMEAMKALARDRRGFIYYTDTPLPQSLQWNTDMPQRRSFFRRLARRQRLKWIFRHADSVLATGRPGVRAVIDLGCLPEKAVVFPYWVALPRVTHEYRRRHEFRIIGVGQLIYRKGYDIALQALRQAIEAHEDLSLKLIGSGPQRENLERQIAKLGLDGHVQLLGWLQPSCVLEELLKASAFIHPARWEPFGVSVLEAMAAGLPVLGSDQTMAALDRVKDCTSGFIHRTGDANQLAQQIKRLFSDAESPRRMGSAARKTAEEWPPERGVQIIKDLVRRC